MRDMPLIDRREILEAMIPAGIRIQFSPAMHGRSSWSIRPGSKVWFRSARIASIAAATRPHV
ncbi:hypothetical protein RFM98_19400 [Mesorhizobium sp. VK9D]|nr:hypothetical protein [Mesorhizobium sp. VK9D]MDX8454934.1 hypothetical protein [Mesorhizobium sp. VK9D]